MHCKLKAAAIEGSGLSCPWSHIHALGLIPCLITSFHLRNLIEDSNQYGVAPVGLDAVAANIASQFYFVKEFIRSY